MTENDTYVRAHRHPLRQSSLRELPVRFISHRLHRAVKVRTSNASLVTSVSGAQRKITNRMSSQTLQRLRPSCDPHSVLACDHLQNMAFLLQWPPLCHSLTHSLADA